MPFSDFKLRITGQLTIESLDLDRPFRESKDFQNKLTDNDKGYGCWFDECYDLKNVLVSVKFTDFQFILRKKPNDAQTEDPNEKSRLMKNDKSSRFQKNLYKRNSGKKGRNCAGVRKNSISAYFF